MVSVVIPTLNEANIIKETINHLIYQAGNYEIIVVDGGSSDKTTDIVREFEKIRIVKSPKGRAVQMNTGAKVAKGDILLFLHADTFLRPGAIKLVEDAMQQQNVVGGSFYLKFDKDNPVLSIYSLFSKINHLLFTYGDQAIFVRKGIFSTLQGYKEMELMEDVEIQMRLRKQGKFIKLHKPVITSARRFIKQGIVFQQVRNVLLVILYLAGISPKTLKKFYSNEGES